MTNDNWERACRHADLLRVYGGITIALGIGLGVLFFLNKPIHTGGHDLSKAIYPSLIFTALGIAVLFNLKIASALEGLVFGIIGCWLIVGSVLHVRDTIWVMLNIPIGILCLLPAVSTVIAWRALK